MTLSLMVRGDGITKLTEAVRILGEGKARNAYRRAINEAGARTKTPTGRALAQQTGLKKSVTARALKVSKASSVDLSYTLSGRGGEIDLKHFGARETRRGVSAAPFGKRQIFEGSFIKAGRFPNRVEMKKGGQVFERVRMSRFPIEKMKSGVIIPAEMVKGVTASTFERVGQKELAEKVARHIRLVTKGVLS